MEKIVVSGEYFDVESTLTCGQVFRWKKEENGFTLHSGERSCRVRNEGGNAVIECEDGDADYFARYFDLETDYGRYVTAAEESGSEILKRAAQAGKGIRILNQLPEEAAISFVVSQNNRIPRIRKILNGLCEEFGGRHRLGGKEYASFPSVRVLAAQSREKYRSAGLGYRDEYILCAARAMAAGAVRGWETLPTDELCRRLCKLKGVGEKVADCIALFGFHRFDVFPSDTWIVKLYNEDFGGEGKNAKKIAAYFAERYGNNAGIFQQYLFHYKRNVKE